MYVQATLKPHTYWDNLTLADRLFDRSDMGMGDLNVPVK